MKSYRLVYVFCDDTTGKWQQVKDTPEFGNRAGAWKFFDDKPELFKEQNSLHLMRKEVSFWIEKKVK